MNKPKQEKQFLWDFVQEYILGTGGFGSDEIIKKKQDEIAEDAGVGSAADYNINSRILKEDAPNQNYTSTVGTPEERTLLKYPSEQTIGEQSDYVLFQFKKYNPPFQKRDKKAFESAGERLSANFTGNVKGLNIDSREKLEGYLGKPFPASSYSPA